MSNEMLPPSNKMGSVWEDAQKTNIRGKLNSKVEVEIPGVISLFKDGDNYLIYVCIDLEWKRLSNVEGVGNDNYGFGKGIHRGKENNKIPEQPSEHQSSKVESGGQTEGDA